MTFIAFKDTDINNVIFVRSDLIRALLPDPDGPGSLIITEGSQQPIRVTDEVQELASLLESHVPDFKIAYYN